MQERIEALERMAPQWMEEAGVPGLAMALVEEGKPGWARGFGVKSREGKEPVGVGTVFAAASITKPVAAYGALLLVQEGRLELDRPLIEYLSEPYREEDFDPEDTRLAEVSLRQALSHSGGFGNWQKEKHGKINFAPGSRFGYGGEGYILVQHVMEQVTGLPLEAYVERRVLAPLGMNTSSLVWRDEFAAAAARGHGESNTGGNRFAKARAAFSLNTTAPDLARFVAEMVKRGESAGGAGLRAELRTEMLRPQIPVRGSVSWGLGWGLERAKEGEWFWHWGDLGDMHCFAIGSPQRQEGVVVMTNSGRGHSIMNDLIELATGSEHPLFEDFLYREHKYKEKAEAA